MVMLVADDGICWRFSKDYGWISACGNIIRWAVTCAPEPRLNRCKMLIRRHAVDGQYLLTCVSKNEAVIINYTVMFAANYKTQSDVLFIA
jgi:hypothetical protein